MKIVETYIVIEPNPNVFDESQEEIIFHKAYKTSGGYFFYRRCKDQKIDTNYWTQIRHNDA